MWRVVAFFSVCSLYAEEGFVEKLSGGHKYVSGLAWSREGHLLISDQAGARIVRVDGKGPSVLREGLSAAAVAADEDGRIYVCDAKERRVLRIDRKGKAEIVAERWEGKRLNGPRRIALTKSGHIFFTDPAYSAADEQRELPFYGIFHVNPKGELGIVARLDSRPNGIAVSHDGKTLYATIADERTVLAWTLEKNGTASQQRIVVRDIDGIPDGLDVASDGRLYIAARDLLVYAPDGKQISKQAVQGQATDVKLGEADLKTVFVAAGTTVYRIRSKEEASH